jgi:hypothetical protein
MRRGWILIVAILLCVVLGIALQQMQERKRAFEQAKTTIDDLAYLELERGDQESPAFVKSVRTRRAHLRAQLERGEVTPNEIFEMHMRELFGSNRKVVAVTPEQHKNRIVELEKKLSAAETP